MIPVGNEDIPRATPIALTADERQDLDALAGSRKSEARMHERARIVLLAAGGMGSRAIGREVGCTRHRLQVASALRPRPHGRSERDRGSWR